MSQTERNKAVVRRFLEEVVSTGDTGRLAELVSPDCIETDSKVRVRSGVDVDRLLDGLVVEHGGAANMLQPFLEAGALAPRA